MGKPMLKRINIQSLLQAKESLSDLAFDAFLDYYAIEMKKTEMMDLSILAVALRELEEFRIGQLDNFYIGYKIPQIGKEFDLLKFRKDSIINVELKSECGEDQILTQLLRNKYYLSFIGRPVFAFTFVSKTKILYFLTEHDRLEIVDLGQLLKLISKQSADDLSNPDALFDPSAYLVSPFNSTERFLAGEYFLTHQQEEAKTHILKLMQSSNSAKFVSITGSAGTGKTLLTYDVAKVLIKRGMKLLIIHCGNLNEGHIALNSRGWDISAAKELKDRDLAMYDLIVVDEAQRIYEAQLKKILENASQHSFHCIFSYDKTQTLHNIEAKKNVAAKIEAIKSIVHFKLSDKIRTNKEIAAFIKMLFKNTKVVPISSNGNIEINYFQTLKDAKQYLDDLDKEKWEVLRFTPSLFKKEHHEKYSDLEAKTSHKVIGQEFDAVAIAIDQYFKYDESGDLMYVGGTYYAPVSMLLQNITRARKRLNIVLINNEPLLTRCLGILS
jgi:DNA replication protein DnaC